MQPNFDTTMLLEQIIKSVCRFLKGNEVMSSCQYSFVKNRCQTNFLLQHNYLAYWMGESSRYLDFRKAFDAVPHDIVIVKQRKYCLNEITPRWVYNWSENIFQAVLPVYGYIEPLRAILLQGFPKTLIFW